MPEFQHPAVAYAKAFDDENGGDPVRQDSMLFFPSGARRSITPLGLSFPPPESKFGRAKAIAYYWELRVEHAVEKFDDERQKLLEDPNSWAYEDQHIPVLDKLHKEVKRCQRQLAKARQDMEEVNPRRVSPAEARRRAQQDDEVHQKQLAFKRRLKNYQI